jgi:hypothetical protein
VAAFQASKLGVAAAGEQRGLPPVCGDSSGRPRYLSTGEVRWPVQGGGTKPTDLPIERPARLDLVVNLKTAKSLGIAIPETILVRADAVLE